MAKPLPQVATSPDTHEEPLTQNKAYQAHCVGNVNPSTIESTLKVPDEITGNDSTSFREKTTAKHSPQVVAHHNIHENIPLTQNEAYHSVINTVAESTLEVPYDNVYMIPDDDVHTIPDDDVHTIPDDEVYTIPDDEVYTNPDEVCTIPTKAEKRISSLHTYDYVIPI